MQIKLGDVWDDMLAFARREQALVVPLALALFGLPQLFFSLVSLLVGDPKTDPSAATIFLLCLLGCGAISLLGNLAMSALVLNPGGSVREALAVALQRFGGAVGAVLIVLLVALAICMPAGLILALLHIRFDPQAPNPALFLVLIIAMFVSVVLGARLALVWAWVIAHGRGGWAALRGSFAVSRPVAWRLLLTIILFFTTLQVALWAVSLVGPPLELVTGSKVAIDAVLALVAALIATVGSALWTIFCACLFRRLDEPAVSAAFE